MSPASTQAIELWRQAGWQVHSQVVRGPLFWQTTEIEDAPDLIAATLAALQETAAARPPLGAAPLAAQEQAA